MKVLQVLVEVLQQFCAMSPDDKDVIKESETEEKGMGVKLKRIYSRSAYGEVTCVPTAVPLISDIPDRYC